MKKTKILAAAFFMLTVGFYQEVNAQVSGNDVPRIISYQGQVTANDGKAMNGTHHITTTLYSDHFGKNSVWQGEYSTEIANGIFTVMLGSGKSPLPEISEMNRPLWVGIKVDGGNEMKPLTQLSGVPYAMNIPDKSITSAKLAPDVQSALFGAGKEVHPATANSAVYWSETGNNSTTAGTDYVGTSDSVALEIHVNDGDATANRGSKRIMRYEPATNSGNIIGGFQGNLMASGVEGSVISGGGSNAGINEIRSNYSGIASGKSNLIGYSSNNSFILGGSGNTIGTSVIGGFIAATANSTINNSCTGSNIDGGQYNIVQDGGTSGAGKFCTIVGGDHLTAQSYAQTVMGHYNTARGTSVYGGAINAVDPLLIIGNGTANNARSTAFEVSDNGHSIVYHSNGGSANAITGATYKDNIIYAWGYWDAAAVVSKFGCTITQNGGAGSGSGSYHVVLNLEKPDGSSTCLNNQDAAIVVTPYNTNFCTYAQVVNLSNNTNTVTTFDIQLSKSIVLAPCPTCNPNPTFDYTLGCDAIDGDFMFIVVGRPH